MLILQPFSIPMVDLIQKFYFSIISLSISGEFSAPLAGVYSISFSVQGYNDAGERNWVYVAKNGVNLEETEHETFYTGSGARNARVGFTSGRTIYQILEAGDKISLKTGTVDDGLVRILFCVEFVVGGA